MNRYRVTIEDMDDEASRPVVAGRDEDLAWAMYHALTAHDPARVDQVVAELVVTLADWDKFEPSDCLPGNQEAIGDRIAAARRIAAGWEKHDEIPPR